MRALRCPRRCVDNLTASSGPGTERTGERGGDPRSPSKGERELVEQLRAGDAAARTATVRRYHSALVHHACRILRDQYLAEDVVQEAWLAAFACIDGFNPRSSL